MHTIAAGCIENDIPGSEPDSVIDDVDTKMKVKKLYRVLEENLKERERMIIRLRYGPDNDGCKTRKEVAKMLQISSAYVSRIEKRAMEKLREGFSDELK